jgi:uncharacterized protein (DUF427 family)
MNRRIKPKKGQESVWDYPRPPRLEATSKLLEVYFDGQLIARTNHGYRVLETSHPPGYYIPLADVNQSFLLPSAGTSYCEFKGRAQYYDLVSAAKREDQSAWYYPDPTPAYAPIANYLAFYPSRMDRCLVDGEIVTPQAGAFYGGWITADIVGPFKGDPGTMFW